MGSFRYHNPKVQVLIIVFKIFIETKTDSQFLYNLLNPS